VGAAGSRDDVGRGEDAESIPAIGDDGRGSIASPGPNPQVKLQPLAVARARENAVSAPIPARLGEKLLRSGRIVGKLGNERFQVRATGISRVDVAVRYGR